MSDTTPTKQNSSLGWIRDELNKSLNEARLALESYVEGDDSGNIELLQQCQLLIRQISGTLQMVQLEGAMLLTGEMTALLDTIVSQDNPDEVDPSAFEALMRAIIQLPDYFTRVQSGQADAAVILLPLINDLRAAYGQSAVSEQALFSPDIANILPDQEDTDASPGDIADVLKTTRQRIHLGILALFRGDDADTALTGMVDLYERYFQAASAQSVIQLYWLSAGLTEAIKDGGIDIDSVPVKPVFGQIDQQSKIIIDEGEEKLAADPPRELLRTLLYYIALSDSSGRYVQQICERFRLREHLPREDELKKMRDELAGPSDEVLATVVDGINQELERARNMLDLYNRVGEDDQEKLQSMVQALRNAAGTVAMVGQVELQNTLNMHCEKIEAYLNGQGTLEETGLETLPDALLQAESTLAALLPKGGDASTGVITTAVGPSLTRSGMYDVMMAVIKESAVNMSNAKDVIAAFASNPEQEREQLGGVNDLLQQVAGSLQIASHHRASDATYLLRQYIGQELVTQSKTPGDDDISTLADAVSGIDYYLDAVVHELPNRDEALSLAESSLAALGYGEQSEAEVDHAAVEGIPEGGGEDELSLDSDTYNEDFELPSSDTDDEALTLAEQDENESLEELVDEIAEYSPDADFESSAIFDLDESMSMAMSLDEDLRVDPGEIGEPVEIEEDVIADIEEVEVEAPVESEEEIEARVHASSEDSDFSGLPSIDAVEETPEPELEEVKISAPEETEEELQARMGIDAENDAFSDLPSIDVSDEVLEDASEDVLQFSQAADDIAGLSDEASSDDFAVPDLGEAEVAAEVEDDSLAAGAQEEGDAAGVDDVSMSAQMLKTASPLGDDLDEEIVDIFLEEAEDVLAELQRQFPEWKADHDNQEALAVIRRAFHTLKGSGRMVGASQIGEFAWAMENMLNKVMSRAIDTSDDVIMVVGEAIDELPAMVAHLQGGDPPSDRYLALCNEADLLSKGEWSESRQVGVDETVDMPESDIEVDEAQQAAYPDAVDESDDMPSGISEVTPTPSSPLKSEELRRIYSDETQQYVNTLRSFVEQCRAGSGSCLLQDEHVRVVHTMHGGSATVGAFDLNRLLAVAEPLIVALQENRKPADKDILSLLDGLVAQIQLFLDEINGAEEPYVFDEQLLQELENTYAYYKELLELENTGGISVVTKIELEERAEVDSDVDDSAALAEIGSSLEDLHDMMSDDDLGEAEVKVEDAPEPAVDEVDIEPSEGIDPEIRDIFIEETTEQLLSIENQLDALQSSPGNRELVIGIQRDIHTLKGGARMVDYSPLSELGHAMESLLERVAEGQVEVDTPLFGLLYQVRDELQVAFDALQRGDADVPVNEAIIAQLRAYPEGVDVSDDTAAIYEVATQSIDAGDIPDDDISDGDISFDEDEPSVGLDLIDIFMDEADDLLDAIDDTLNQWQEQPGNLDHVIQLQRDIHTLKGGARMVSLPGLGDLGHSLETLLTSIVDGHTEVASPMFGVLFEVKDELQTMYEHAKSGQGDFAPSKSSMQALERLRLGDVEHLSDEPSASDVDEAAPVVGDEAVASTGRDAGETEQVSAEDQHSLSRIVASAEQQDEKPSPQNKRSQPRVEGETIRVRSDLIDNLVNLAGESNIFRSRLEQQSSSFRFSLNELDQTVTRLKDQLRKMEIETEAQILFRHEREDEINRDANFDPLEMDRYSQMQQLSKSLMESIGDLSSLQDMLGGLTRDSELLLVQQGRVNTELQDRLMQARVVPFAATMASRMRRIIRQTCQQLGKKAELKLVGANEEMDRHVLDRMVAPLEHMLRNAVAHGIESADIRAARGKREVGTITITVDRQGGEIIIQVADDGAGINTDGIRRKAESSGLIVDNADMTDDDLMQLILLPGFSTVETVSQIAGRGVGMDVVNNEIKQLGGSVLIESVYERGASITIRLPFTLAINQALLVGVGDDLYAIPLSSIEGVSRISSQDAGDLLNTEENDYLYGGENYQMSVLGNVLGRDTVATHEDAERPALILVKAGGHRLAFYVERIMGHSDIVVKSLGAQVSSVQGVAGGTILGDGRVALILDVPALARMVAAEHGLSKTERVQLVETPQSMNIKVMVVDDSITVRRVTTRLLERHDMEVVTAKDGVEATALLEEVVPDVMLLDVEMPRMDGYELATHMRNDQRYRDVPILMITSRTGEKHRERAEAIGVDRYLGKPYQETDLLGHINDVLEARRSH